MPGESWEDLPDVPETASQSQGAGSWEDIPDVNAQELPEIDLRSEWKLWPDPIDEEEKKGKVRSALLATKDLTGDDSSDILTLSKTLGVPTSTIAGNVAAWRQSAETSGFDPDEWARQNPMLAAAVVDSPYMAPLVAKEKSFGPIFRALHAATDWLRDFGKVDVSKAPAEGWGLAVKPEPGVPLETQMEDWQKAAQEQQTSSVEAQARTSREVSESRAERSAPKTILERDDAKARVLADDPSIISKGIVLYARGQETSKQLEISRLQFQQMLAENGISGNPADIAMKLHDAQLEAQPRAYGDDSGLMRDLSIALTGATSTVEVAGAGLKGAVELGGAAALGGAALGGAGGAFVTRTPAGAAAWAAEGAMMGARWGAPKGAAIGASWATFNLEAGDTYGQLRSMKTDQGQELSPSEAMGGAVIYGALATGLEFISLKQQAGIVTKPMAARVRGLLVADPAFRQLAKSLGEEWAKSMATEGLTEGLQDVLQQVTGYVEKSIKDQAPQEGPVVDWAQTLEQAEAGAMSSALIGGISSGVSLGLQTSSSNRTEKMDQQVPILSELASNSTVQKAPAEFAKVIERATSENGGAPVRSLFVEASAVMRLFQDRTDTAKAEVDKILGEGAGTRLIEAASTGGRLEIPMEDFLSKWGSSETGKALLDDTTTSPSDPTPRQRRVLAPEIEAEAQRMAQEAEVDQTTNQRISEFEQQILATETVKPREAKVAGALLRAYMETQASDFETSVSKLFPDFQIEVGKGDETSGTLTQEPNRTSALDALAEEKLRRTQELNQQADTLSESEFEAKEDEIRSWYSAEKAKIESGPQASFSEQVYSAAKRADRAGFNMALIADVYDEYTKSSGENLSLDEFKKRLVRAQESGELTLERFDLPPTVLFGITSERSYQNEINKGLGGMARVWDSISTRRPFKRLAQAPIRVTPSEALKAKAQTSTPEQRAREAFFDPVTGLKNKKGWDATERKPGMVAIITSPAMKAINDAPTGGHDVANNLLRLMGGVIGGVDSEAARHGTNLLFHVVNQAQFMSALAKVRAAVPAGIEVEGAFSPSLDESFKKLDSIVEAKRQAGKLPARGVTKFDLSKLGPETFSSSPAQVKTPTSLLAKAQSMTPESFSAEVYSDPTMPGVLSRTGFEAAPEAKFVTAFDLKGLKKVNTLFGKTIGDAILTAFGEAATRAGGQEVGFAHFSGDEFAAKHDDANKLADFESSLRRELDNVVVRATYEDGRVTELVPDFRSGTGERTYGSADQALNLAKRAETDVRAAGQGTPGQPGSPQGGQAGAPGPRGNQGPGSEVARLYQEKEPPKGYVLPEVTASRTAIRIFLNKSADFSTVVHELSHAFLEMSRALSERPDAPERIKNTVQWIRVFVGSEGGGFSREQHEKFARSFEAYILEGQAPSGVLAKAFARAKLWMMDIYRSLMGVPGSELNADSRRIFDALLATEDQVRAIRRREGQPTRAPRTSEEASSAWHEKIRAERERYDEGSRRVQVQAIKDAMRETEGWWKEGVQTLKAQFDEEYEKLPARVAQRTIEEAGVSLNSAEVKRLWPRGRLPVKVSPDGLRPQLVAEMAGFPSAEVLIAGLAGLRPKERWVSEQAESEMRRRNPGILDDMKRMRRELSDGLASVTEARLLDEWADLKKQDPSIGASQVEVMKRAAALMIERRQVGALRPSQALSQERSAASRKARAAAKGDWTSAAAAAKEELLNAFLYREATKAESEMEKLVTLAKRLGRREAIERLGKASPVYRDAIGFLLGTSGLGAETSMDVTTIKTAVDQMNGDAVLIGDPDWLAPVSKAIASGKSWREWTVGEARNLRDAISNLQAAARSRSQVLLDDQRVDRERVKAKALEEIGKVVPLKGPLSSRHAMGSKEKLFSFFSSLDGRLTAPIDLVRDLVGDDQSSTLWRSMVLPLRNAEIVESDLLRTTLKPILDAFEKLPASIRKTWNDPIDGRTLFPQHIEDFVPRRRYELIMMALNSGSASSISKLSEGRGITKEQIQAALAQLTTAEIDWVNQVLESIGSLRDRAFALEERVTGIRPEAVQAEKMDLPNGVLKGGYFPLRAIKEGSVVGEKQAADTVAGLFDASYTRPTTAHGHLKTRTGAVYPVELDPDIIRRHLMQVVHDISFREPVTSIARIVMDPEITSALNHRLGPEKTPEFLQWLKDIGSARGIPSDFISRLTRIVRTNMASALLSGPSTAIGNLANLAAAIPSTKLKSKHLAASLLEFSAHPIESQRSALEASGILRSLFDTLASDFDRSLGSVRKGIPGRALEVVREIGTWLMRTIDHAVSTIVWLGAHRQALADGMDSKTAIRWADDLVLQVQPSISTVERAGILRDPVWGLLTMFYGYLSVAYRAQHRILSPLFTQEFQAAKGAAKATAGLRVAGRLLGFWIAFGTLGELLMGRGPEDGDGDDDDPENQALKSRNWFLRKTLVAPLSTIPIVPLAYGIEGVLLKKPVNARTDPLSNLSMQLITKLGKQILKMWDGEGEPEKLIIEAMRSLGLLTGFPSRLAETTGKFLFQLPEGEEPLTFSSLASGIFYGKREGQPENIFQESKP